MWTQLHSHQRMPTRLSSDYASNTAFEDEGDEVATAYAHPMPLLAALGGGPRRNQILGALSESHFALLKPSLDLVNLASGQVIYEGGDALHHVYFPTTCTASLLSTTVDGETAELALTGRSGLIGVPLVLGAVSMAHSVQIQSQGQAYRMSAERFVQRLQQCEQLKQLALSYVQSLMTQMAQSIVCSRHHSVSERLSQWMLLNADGLEAEQLSVTHETIGHMLGVRRESVTQAAGKLQAAGWIRNSRGKILIQNREGLLQSVCECYARIKTDAAQYAKRLEQLSDHTSPSKTQYAPVPEPVDVDKALDEDMAADAPAAASELQKYVDAYDFAPLGFVTLDVQGCVVQTNLSGAIMLDVQRSQCRHTPFTDFLDQASHSPFLAFHQEVLSGQCRRLCVVVLSATLHRAAMTLHLHATVDETGEENRMVMVDVGSADAWRFPQAQSAHTGALVA